MGASYFQFETTTPVRKQLSVCFIHGAPMKAGLTRSTQTRSLLHP